MKRSNDEIEILRAIALCIVRKRIDFVLNHRHNNDLKYIPSYETEIHKATGIHRNTIRKYLEKLKGGAVFLKYYKSREDRQHNEAYYGIRPRTTSLGPLYFLESELQLPWPFTRLKPSRLEEQPLSSLIHLKNAIVSLRQAPNKPLPV